MNATRCQRRAEPLLSEKWPKANEKCSGWPGTFNGLGNLGIRSGINIYLHNCVDCWAQDMYCCTLSPPPSPFHFYNIFFLLFFCTDMAEHWVTVFHLIKSSGRPVQMLRGLRLKGVLTLGEWERPPANLTLGSGGWFAFLRPVAWHDYASHFTILSTVEYRGLLPTLPQFLLVFF